MKAAVVKAAVVVLLAAAMCPAQVKLPGLTRTTLPNGITLVLVPRKDIPMVTVRVVARGGEESDPAEMAGLSDVTAELLRRGTPSRSADKFAEELDALGASLSTGSTPQSTEVSLEFLAKDTAASLQLLADAVLHPTFAEEEVRKVLDEQIDAARSVKDEPSSTLRRYLPAMLYGPGHPYGRVADELSLARITRRHIAAYHKRYFAGRNVIAVAVGDFEAQQMRAAMEAAFGSLPAGEAFRPPTVTSGVRAGKQRLLLVDKPDATQTYFAIAMPGVARTHPDRVGLWLVNTLFGDRFTSMLNDELRVNSGLTYGAGSRISLNRLPGAIYISSYTKNESTVAAIDLALTVLQRLRDRGLTAAQLASAKAYVKGIYPTDNLETNEQLARVIGDLELFGQTRGEIDDLFARIGAVTPEQATALARQHYVASNLQFCLVGKADEIRDKVAKYAPGAMRVIPATDAGIRVPEW